MYEKPKLTTNQRQRTSQPQRFDPDHRLPKPDVTILTGSAYVVDGDTLVIKKTQVRLFGVDAPEMSHPYGKKAKWALVSLCNSFGMQDATFATTAGRRTATCVILVSEVKGVYVGRNAVCARYVWQASSLCRSCCVSLNSFSFVVAGAVIRCA